MSIEFSSPCETSLISLAGAVIVLPEDAAELQRFAAGELARYLYLLTGHVSQISDKLPSAGMAVVLDQRLALELGKPAGAEVSEQGYRLAVVRAAAISYLVIASRTQAGVLYGVYGLLEELGMGFYAGGDAFPELPSAAETAGRARTLPTGPPSRCAAICCTITSSAAAPIGGWRIINFTSINWRICAAICC